VIALRHLPAAALLTFSAVPALALPMVAVGAVDYPPGAVPGREEIVTAAFVSGPGGVTIRCRVVAKSHVPALDDATCAILKARARFASQGEQRIIFRWFGNTPSRRPDLAQRGDPLIIWVPGWISNDDYPVAAHSNGVEGEVQYRVEVSPMGKPLQCAVTASSGSQLLDGTTCDLILKRAMFIPAIDARGRPRAGQAHGTIAWRIHG